MGEGSWEKKEERSKRKDVEEIEILQP